jgi:predicted O-methyltransferase YrrM
MFADESIDFVYIDASHEYDDLVADIKAWLPKLNKGGIMAGDDYGVGVHPDVKRAVDELFPFAQKEGLVWIVRKE